MDIIILEYPSSLPLGGQEMTFNLVLPVYHPFRTALHTTEHHAQHAIPISISHRIVLHASEATTSLVPHAYPVLNKAEHHAVSMDTS